MPFWSAGKVKLAGVWNSRADIIEFLDVVKIVLSPIFAWDSIVYRKCEGIGLADFNKNTTDLKYYNSSIIFLL